jgi:poly(3-hydroxyalkanoate) synthetase
MIGYGMDAFIPPPSQFFEEFKFVNTSAPVLFVNTAADPVTPMSSVHDMSRLFGGSSWFIQNSPGHSYHNSKSKCTDDIILAYLKDGTVPEVGTWCEPDVEPKWYFGFGEE